MTPVFRFFAMAPLGATLCWGCSSTAAPAPAPSSDSGALRDAAATVDAGIDAQLPDGSLPPGEVSCVLQECTLGFTCCQEDLLCHETGRLPQPCTPKP